MSEVVDDRLAGLVDRHAGQPAIVGVEAAGLVDGREHGQVVHGGQHEVLGAGARRDVHDACAGVQRDVLPRDHPVLHRRARRERVERPLVAQADQLAALADRAELDVLGLRLHRTQSPEGRRP